MIGLILTLIALGILALDYFVWAGTVFGIIAFCFFIILISFGLWLMLQGI